jgi:biotin carboxylase
LPVQRYLLFIELNTTGSGMQALAKSREVGMEPVLFTRNVNLYQCVQYIGCPIVLCETNDLAMLQTAITDFLQTEPGEVCGITTTSEFYVETVALLAAACNQPTNPLVMVQACRNKSRMRHILTEGGFLQPRFTVVGHIDDVEAAVAHVGLPCVVKPCADTGSYGVKLCHSVNDAQAHAAGLLQRRTNARGQPINEAVLCEEYINGPEYSVETFAYQGDIICVGITQKMLTGLPYFVECGHIFPAVLPEESCNTIEQAVRQALAIMGNTFGPAHTEVKLTADGCVIVEINPRLAGGMIPELVWQAKGIDLLKGQVLASCGRPPTLTPTRSAYAGIYFLTASCAGKLVAITNIEMVRRQKDVVRVTVTATADAQVDAPKSAYDRLGYVILRNDSYTDLQKRLEQIRKEIGLLIVD